MKKIIEKVQVSEIHCDYRSSMKVSQIFLVMQEMAEKGANALGMSRESMIGNHQTFVLSRMSLQIDKLPKLYENIEITTWPKKTIKLFYIRDFFFKQQNTITMRASSVWAILDLKSRKIVRQPATVHSANEQLVDEALTYMPPRIKLPEQMNEVGQVLATYSMTDPNGHINNIRYIEWVYDYLPKKIIEFNSSYTMDINYVNEVYYKDEILIEMGEKGDNTILCGKVNEKICFMVQIRKN
ncbi:MAG: hypothetical protein KAG94_01135 [Clostridiales bacterium]|nr:hypothetical protein [Clostridiales bacterium]